MAMEPDNLILRLLSDMRQEHAAAMEAVMAQMRSMLRLYGELEHVHDRFGRIDANIDVLRKDVAHLGGGVATLRADFARLGGTVAALSSDMGGLRAEVGELRAEVGGLRAEVGGLRSETEGLRIEMATLKSDVSHLAAATTTLHSDLSTFRMDVDRHLRRLGSDLIALENQNIARHGETINLMTRLRDLETVEP